MPSIGNVQVSTKSTNSANPILDHLFHLLKLRLVQQQHSAGVESWLPRFIWSNNIYLTICTRISLALVSDAGALTFDSHHIRPTMLPVGSLLWTPSDRQLYLMRMTMFVPTVATLKIWIFSSAYMIMSYIMLTSSAGRLRFETQGLSKLLMKVVQHIMDASE